VRRKLAVLVLVLLHAIGHADEMTERAELETGIRQAVAKEEFGRVDKEYQAYRAAKARMPSGTYRASRLIYAVDFSGRPGGHAKRSPEHEAAIVEAEERAVRWQRQNPRSSLAALALASAYIQHAFFFRGEDVSSAVTPKGWEGYREYLGRAARHLAQPTLDRDEAWYYARMTLNKYDNSSIEDFIRLIDEGTNRFPQFYDLYFAAASRLEPKWGGSIEGLEWVAEMAVRKTRPVDGEALYARVYWSYGQVGYKDTLFESTKADWNRMKKGFEDIVRHYPDPWNLNNYAWYACLARDRETTRQLFQRIGSEVDTRLWPDRRLARCKAFAAETGKP
jgi:hypothetical protein